jgi:hypothetical protein
MLDGLTGGAQRLGPVTTLGLLERSAFARTMDTLGRTLRGDMTIARIRLASLILFQSHRVAPHAHRGRRTFPPRERW